MSFLTRMQERERKASQMYNLVRPRARRLRARSPPDDADSRPCPPDHLAYQLPRLLDRRRRHLSRCRRLDREYDSSELPLSVASTLTDGLLLLTLPSSPPLPLAPASSFHTFSLQYGDSMYFSYVRRGSCPFGSTSRLTRAPSSGLLHVDWIRRLCTGIQPRPRLLCPLRPLGRCAAPSASRLNLRYLADLCPLSPPPPAVPVVASFAVRASRLCLIRQHARLTISPHVLRSKHSRPSSSRSATDVSRPLARRVRTTSTRNARRRRPRTSCIRMPTSSSPTGTSSRRVSRTRPRRRRRSGASRRRSWRTRRSHCASRCSLRP